MSTATPAAPHINTAALYGPNDSHLVRDGEDEQGRPRYAQRPGLGPEADAILLASGSERANSVLLTAERRAIAEERRAVEALRAEAALERAEAARIYASLPVSVRNKMAASTDAG